MTKIRKHEWEDQTIVGFSFAENNISIKIKLCDEQGRKVKDVLVDFLSVHDLKIDSISSCDIKMISHDGEIIHFELEGQRALIIVIWHDRGAKTPITKSYKFHFDSLRMT